MRILFVTSGSVKSNFTYRIVQLARSMKKLGHDVAIVAPKADKYNNFIAENVSEIFGVRVIQPFQFKTKRIEINLLPYMFHALYLVLKNRSDLVYIYKPTPISIVGVFAKLFYKSKIVLDMDDVGSEVMKIEGHPHYQIKLVEWCERLAAYYSDAIVTASNYLNNRYKKVYPHKPILTISNGVDNSWFKPLVNTESENRVVFMGAVNRSNIVEPLLDVLPEVIKKVPNLKVLLIGDGKFLPYFKQKVESLNLSSFVEFTGWLKVEEAEKLLKAGDIGYCYMPDELTTKSASNMKVMQYMARGVLPLVSDIGDLPAYVDFGSAGYIVKPDDNVDLENKLVLALKDQDRLEKSKKAQEFSINNFDWDKLAENFSTWFFNISNVDKQETYVLNTSTPGNVGGGEIRNFYILKNLAKLTENKVKLFCISDFDVQADSEKIKNQLGIESRMVLEVKRTLWRSVESIFIKLIPPYMNDFKAGGLDRIFIDACVEKIPGTVYLSQMHSYYVVRKYIPWLKKNGVKIVLDCHNIEYKLLKETSEIFSFFKRILGKILSIRMKMLEIEAVKNSDIILACSESDKEFFVKYNKNTFVVPNGVDVELYKDIAPSSENSIIFMGGTGYPPNSDAVRFYISQIHSLIKKEIPDLKVYLVGTTNEWLKNIGVNDDSIIGLGFVPDVAEYLKKSAVGISPIRYGSGTRLKILTYMASGLPVVSTRKGAEGVNYLNGKDIYLEDNASRFAIRVIELLRNRDMVKEMGENGRKFVSENFDWEKIGEKLINIYKHV